MKNTNKQTVRWGVDKNGHYELRVRGSYIEVYSVDLGYSWRIDGTVKGEWIHRQGPMSLTSAILSAEDYLGVYEQADRSIFYSA